MRVRKSIPKDRGTVIKGQWRMAMIFISCLLLSLPAFTQKISTLASKEKILIGEQVFVKIKVEGVTQEQIQEHFRFPDTVNRLEILADSIEQLNNSTFQHTLTVTSFDSGTWQLPAFTMMLTDKRPLSSNPVNITVLPVDVSGMQDYHDIKDILEVNPENNWWIIGSLILIALISLFGILWFMNDRSTENTTVPMQLSSLADLYSTTMQQLVQLEKVELSNKENIVHVFSRSCMVVRSFIEKATGNRTSHLTSGEYMAKQKNKLSSTELENSFFQFLRLSDAVKFAKYIPPANETENVFPMLRSLITSVYQQTKTGA